MFNVHINRSGSYWDIHVFDLLVWPCLEMTFYQHLQGSFRATGNPVTQGRHYSDHPSHCVSPRPGIEPGLTARLLETCSHCKRTEPRFTIRKLSFISVGHASAISGIILMSNDILSDFMEKTLGLTLYRRITGFTMIPKVPSWGQRCHLTSQHLWASQLW